MEWRKAKSAVEQCSSKEENANRKEARMSQLGIEQYAYEGRSGVHMQVTEGCHNQERRRLTSSS